MEETTATVVVMGEEERRWMRSCSRRLRDGRTSRLEASEAVEDEEEALRAPWQWDAAAPGGIDIPGLIPPREARTLMKR